MNRERDANEGPFSIYPKLNPCIFKQKKRGDPRNAKETQANSSSESEKADDAFLKLASSRISPALR